MSIFLRFFCKWILLPDGKIKNPASNATAIPGKAAKAVVDIPNEAARPLKARERVPVEPAALC